MIRDPIPGLPDTIELNGERFSLVIAQRDGKSAIYKGSGRFLRIGERDKILSDINNHKKMLEYGFPVSALLGEGEWNGMPYFLEASLGEQKFTDIFSEDIVKTGAITEKNFTSFLGVVERFARAQLRTVVDPRDYAVFGRAVHIDTMCEELPHLKEKIQARFEHVQSHTASLPFVLTHGDFNPHNMYPGGVIDLENSHFAPAGYDLVSAIMHIDYFPAAEGYEYRKSYDFTPEQRGRYYAGMDAIYAEAGLAALSDFIEDYSFCRAAWLAARMQRTPKLQQFRYELFTKEYLQG